jgi:hypothetical protein
MHGAPGQNYQVRSGRRYVAESTTGLIQNVEVGDIIDLVAAGCCTLGLAEPTGQDLTSPLSSSKNRAGRANMTGTGSG